MKLTFHGGAGMVTGANYLLETSEKGNETRILVDCGLHQGSSYCEKLNFEPFPYKPSEIDAVFITHAHIDHIGRLPKLYKEGFRGKIYSTRPTKDFAEHLLLDSEHILGQEAERHKQTPLYNINDVNETLKLWEKRSYHEKIEIGPAGAGLIVEFYNAGHILGSASVLISENLVKGQSKRIVFSGDLGNMPAPLIRETEYLDNVDYALVESVYGGRLHEESAKRKDILEDLIEETVKAGGVLMIPAFALERTQELLFELNELVENGRVPAVPVFIDSPLAIRLTGVYQKYCRDGNYFNKEAINLLRGGDAIFNFPNLQMTLTKEQSKKINDVPAPKAVIAGAGMSNGGRILHHERRYLSDPKSTILFIGYQAQGSLGRQILDGAKKVKILGEEIPVRCRVKNIGGYSAHADQPQLLKWLTPLRNSLKKLFVVQGEAEEAAVLVQKARDDLAIDAVVPTAGQQVML